MSTRVGLISDVHASPEPAAEALAIFKSQGVDATFCLGDIAGYGGDFDATVALLVDHGCQAILGNHEIWYLEDHADAEETPASRWVGSLPRVVQLTIEGKRLYMVHGSPPDSTMDGIRLLDLDGNVIADAREYWSQRLQGFGDEVLLVGHTHQVFCERIGGTLVINPGSTRFNHSCAILNLPGLELQIFGLSGKQPVRSWNWGMRK